MLNFSITALLFDSKRGTEKIMKRYFQFLSLGIILFCVASFIKNPPFWNRTDDATNIQFVKKDWAGKNIKQVVVESVRSDLKGWGLFFPLYRAYSYVMYGTFKDQPVQAHIVLMLVVSAFFVGWAFLFEAMVSPHRDGEWKYLFFIFCFAFSPHLQHLFYLSIQEKFILAAGFFGFFSMHRYFKRLHKTVDASFQIKTLLMGMTGLFLGLSVGWFAKATTIFLLGPILFWLLMDYIQEGRKENLAMIASAAIIGAVCLTFSMTHRGYYSSKYSPLNFAGYLPQLNKKVSSYLIFIALVTAISISQGRKKEKYWRHSIRAEQLVWPIGFFCFLVLMLPWPGGTTGYYMAGGSIFMVGTMTLAVFLLLAEFPGVAMKRTVMVALLVLTINRAFPCYRMFLTRSGERDVTEWIRDKMVENPSNPPFLGMPFRCQEATESLSYFSGFPNALQRVPPSEPSFLPAGKEAYLITVGECPPADTRGFDLEYPIFEKGDWRIFKASGQS